MPSQKSITPEVVFEVAENLYKEGVSIAEITNRRVRQKIGLGSFGDIAPLLREWVKHKTEAKSLEIEMPEDFRVELRDFGSKLWHMAALKAVEKESIKLQDFYILKRENEGFQQDMDELNGQMGVYKDTLNGLFSELTRLKEEVVAHNRELSVYRAQKDLDGYVQATEKWMVDIEQRVAGIIEQNFSSQLTAKPRDDRSEP